MQSMLVGDIRNIIAIGGKIITDWFHALTTTYWLVTHWDDDHFAGALEYFDKHGEKNRRPQVYGPVLASDGTWRITTDGGLQASE